MTRLLVTTALLFIFIGTGMAEAQYVTRYETSDAPSVEINLDVLNDVQEQQYNAEHDVTREALPARQPAPAPMPQPQQVQMQQPAPVVAAAPAPQPLPPKHRLLKPILTARAPAPEQQPAAQEEMAEPARVVVKHSVIMPSEPDPDEAMAEMQAQADAMLQPEPQAQAETQTETATVEAPIPARKPGSAKRSWSAVDGTPAPYDLPQPPQQMAMAKMKAAPVPAPQAKAEPVKAEPVEVEAEPQPAPEVAATPEPETVLAQADTQPHISEKAGAIISHRPRYSNETGTVPETPPPAPDTTQQAPVVSRPPVVSAPVPHHKPMVQEEPAAVAAPPAAVEPVAALPEEPQNTTVDLATPPAGTMKETAADPAPAMDEPPVVPTIADLTLDFDGNSSDLTAVSRKKLDNVIRQMGESVDGRLQVRGYANGEDGSNSSARRIALSRALSVRSYLMDKGVKPVRVDVRALGAETDRTPKDRVDLIFAH